MINLYMPTIANNLKFCTFLVLQSGWYRAPAWPRAGTTALPPRLPPPSPAPPPPPQTSKHLLLLIRIGSTQRQFKNGLFVRINFTG